jgi:transcriptional regulator with XRE-family HTH domain
VAFLVDSTAIELRVAMAIRRRTGRDIARRVGIHESKLSRILNDRHPAEPDLVARIRAAIVEEETVPA